MAHAGCVPVFYSGLNGSRRYRIPPIIQTHTGTLPACAKPFIGRWRTVRTENYDEFLQMFNMSW